MDETLNASNATVPVELTAAQLADLREAMPRALAVSGLATKGATYYNTAAEQRGLVDGCITELMAIDRGLAAATATLPGVMDFWRGAVAAALLRTRREGSATLTPQEEMAALEGVFTGMPPHRMLNLCVALRAERVNNARTRRLILGAIEGAGPRLELWAVKYRDKMRRALEHAWGKRRATWIVANAPEVEQSAVGLRRGFGEAWAEILKHVFRQPYTPTLPLLTAFAAAPEDFEQLRKLPYEVAKGLWSRHHSSRPFAEVLERTKATMTGAQRQRVQRTAARREVVVDWDPSKRSATELYVYAFECGATDEIRRALDRKAIEAAARLGLNYRRIGVVVDTSASMLGGQSQKNRPLATAYALRDALRASAEEVAVRTTGEGGRFAVPRGDSDLATPFLEVLRTGPEAAFVISDGYENAPAGRLAEVLHRARQMGVQIPVFQIATVAAAEAGSVRVLSRTMPVLSLSDAKAVSTAVLTETFRSDPQEGVRQLLGLARAELGLGERPTTPLLSEVAGSPSEDRQDRQGGNGAVQYRVGRNTYRGVVSARAGDRVTIRRTHRLVDAEWVSSESPNVLVRRQSSVEEVRT